MKRKEVEKIIQAKHKDYALKVIKQIKALDPNCCLSGDDSPLKSVWEEFKYQVQEEESYYYNAYEDTIRQICRQVIKSLPDHEIELLWLNTNSYFNHDEEDPPTWEEILDGIEDYLYSEICFIAES